VSEGTIATTTDPLRDSVLRTLSAHRAELEGYGVRSISLFGSVARGEAGPESDIDVLVDLERGVTLFGLVRLQDWLEALLGRRVDVIPRDGLRKELRQQVFAEEIRAAWSVGLRMVDMIDATDFVMATVHGLTFEAFEADRIRRDAVVAT